MRFRAAVMGTLLLVTLAGAEASAQAPPPSPRTRQAAVAYANQGWTAYRARRYREALQAFRRAEATVHAPTFLIMVARSCHKLGRLTEARSVYQLIVDEQLSADASQAFRQAQAEARTELEAVASRIPTVEITVTGAGSGGAQVALDGLDVPASTPVARDPGSHTLAVGAPGRRGLTKQIVLKEGTRTRVEVDLAAGKVRIGSDETEQGAGGAPQPAGPGRVAADGGAQEDGEPQPVGPGQIAADGSAQEGGDAADGRPSSRSTAVVITGLAATAVGAGLGAAFVLLSNEKASSQQLLLGPACTDPARCPGLDLRRYNDLGHAKADLANAAVWSFLAAGAAGLGTAAYVVLTGQPDARDATATSLSVIPMPGGLVLSKRW
ncbi:tetratricopeptide repeat protein [Sorangium sp. So ce362]|uniref:tetratricopeptide repeat protein n=1 Tax=Sorangium sp. So ce362 TaxID=3133303 RepID=UPI003F5F6CA1